MIEFSLALALRLATSSDHPDAPIVADRPDCTQISFVVPRESGQFEDRLAYQWPERTVEWFDFPEVLLRNGIVGRVELRVGLPVYNAVGTGHSVRF